MNLLKFQQKSRTSFWNRRHTFELLLLWFIKRATWIGIVHSGSRSRRDSLFITLSSSANLQDDLILQKEAGTVVCTLKQHTHQGCVAPVHIGRRNRPTGLFCVELVTFGRGSLPVARRFSPALRPSNNFADTKTPKTSAMEHLFSSLLLAFVSPVFFLRALGTPAVCKAPDSTSGRPTAKLLTVLPVSQPLKKFQGIWTKS